MNKYEVRRATVGLVVGLALASVANASANDGSTTGPTKYRQVSGSFEMPSKVVFRNCNGQEDELAHLKLVDFDPANDRMVYRCMSRGF